MVKQGVVSESFRLATILALTGGFMDAYSYLMRGGVFANAEPETVAGLLDRGVIDLAQLHGGESGDYIRRLRALTGKPIIQAFRITSAQDVMRAETSIADHILLDSGAGTGTAFDWALLRHIKRPYFLAGGLGPGKVERAVELIIR